MNNILKEASQTVILGENIPAEGTSPAKALSWELSWLENFRKNSQKASVGRKE